MKHQKLNRKFSPIHSSNTPKFPARKMLVLKKAWFSPPIPVWLARVVMPRRNIRRAWNSSSTGVAERTMRVWWVGKFLNIFSTNSAIHVKGSSNSSVHLLNIYQTLYFFCVFTIIMAQKLLYHTWWMHFHVIIQVYTCSTFANLLNFYRFLM